LLSVISTRAGLRGHEIASFGLAAWRALVRAS
jgi:hypothetical protein